MPNPVWPVTLPAAWGADASRNPQDNVLRSPMEVGPPKTRRRATAITVATSFTLLLTQAEKDILDTFYYTTLGESLPFDWKDFSVAAQPTKTFKFSRPPTSTFVSGGYWTVAFELEQLP